MKNYVSSGSIVQVTADADVKSGELVVIGGLVGFAQSDAAAGEQVALVTEGVYAVSVAAAADVAVGDVIHLKDGALTTDPADAEVAGVAVKSGSAADGFADIHLKI